MTHFAALLHTLAKRGYTTYARLQRTYPGMSYEGFTQAVRKAKLLGCARKEGRTLIVGCGCCPCCGRALGKEER